MHLSLKFWSLESEAPMRLLEGNAYGSGERETFNIWLRQRGFHTSAVAWPNRGRPFRTEPPPLPSIWHCFQPCEQIAGKRDVWDPRHQEGARARPHACRLPLEVEQKSPRDALACPCPLFPHFQCARTHEMVTLLTNATQPACVRSVSCANLKMTFSVRGDLPAPVTV